MTNEILTRIINFNLFCHFSCKKFVSLCKHWNENWSSYCFNCCFFSNTFGVHGFWKKWSGILIKFILSNLSGSSNVPQYIYAPRYMKVLKARSEVRVAILYKQCSEYAKLSPIGIIISDWIYNHHPLSRKKKSTFIISHST